MGISAESSEYKENMLIKKMCTKTKQFLYLQAYEEITNMTIRELINYRVAERKIFINKVTENSEGRYACFVYGEEGRYIESNIELEINCKILHYTYINLC